MLSPKHLLNKNFISILARLSPKPLLNRSNISILAKSVRSEKKKTYVVDTEGVREDTHKKSVFLVVGPLRFYPPYTNGLVVHANFFCFCFFSLIIAGFCQLFLFLPNFWAKTAGVFCLVVRGVYPPYTLCGPTTKKSHFFMCFFSNSVFRNKL